VAEIYKIETFLVDTGILYALADRKDKWHLRSARFIAEFAGRLVVPSTVLPETCYLLNTCIGQAAEIAFIRAVIDRELVVEQVTAADLARAAEVMIAYADANIGMVDASLVAVAERLKLTKILTTDRRHFAMIKPRHCKGFQLLP
jgi:predicted nucleic acid-binding protein